MLPIRPTWLEIDLKALRSNVSNLKRLLKPSTSLMTVVKSDGYNLGLTQVSRAAAEGGADMLGVAFASEGVKIRHSGIKLPIMTLNCGTFLEQIDAIVKYDLTHNVSYIGLAEALSSVAEKHGRRVKVHVKVDTGMGRIGISPAGAVHFIKQLLALKGLTVEGVYTHLSTADEADKWFAREQFGLFLKLKERLEEEQITIPVWHIGNSAVLLDLPEMEMDMVRAGITIYGCYPSRQVQRRINLESTLSFKTRIGYLKLIRVGSPVSYGRSFIAQRDTVIATLPAGYADGYPRRLNGVGEVLIRGQRCPVVGRVCMDEMMIDVTHVPGISTGDEVVLLGRQGDEEISVEEMAGWLETITYEVLTMFSQRLPRVYREGDDIVEVLSILGPHAPFWPYREGPTS